MNPAHAVQVKNIKTVVFHTTNKNKTMQEIKHILQQHIIPEIYVDFGCIGTRYIHILIVHNGQIKSIGQFIYTIWNEGYLNRQGWGTKDKFKELAIEAEKYRLGERDKEPSLAFNGNELVIY